MDPGCASLLGAPLGIQNSLSLAIKEKISGLVRMGERFGLFSAHDSLVLLCSSIFLPKILYLLRTASCFHSPTLVTYDDTFQSIMCSVLNTNLR